MTEIWLAVVIAGVATIAFKAAGPMLAGEAELPAPLSRVLDLLAPAAVTAGLRAL